MSAGKQAGKKEDSARSAGVTLENAVLPVNRPRAIHCRKPSRFSIISPWVNLMSHSEDKKELAGLARSVEALFGPAPEAGTVSLRDAEPTPDLDSSVDAPPIESSPPSDIPLDDDFMGGFDTVFDDEPSQEAVADFAFEPDPAFPSTGDSEPIAGPLPDAIADPVMDFVSGQGLDSATLDSESDSDDSTLSDAVADFAFEPDPAFPAAASETFAAQADPSADAPVISTEPSVNDVPVVDLGLPPDDGTGENLPGPIDIAVDAMLEGDATQAAEVERLAAELIEGKEIEPVARSVARLVHAAGSPPDPTLFGLAESLMSPVVLGRLARRIGTERDGARRQAYFAVCTSIGQGMAEALRIELADSTDRLSRRIHYDALVAMGDASRPVIEDMIHDDNRFLVRNAVSILGDTGGDNAVALVTSALANPDSRVRREALLSLAKLGDEEASQLIPGFFEDPDLEVRRAAVVASGELRVARSLRSLIALLDQANEPDDVIPLLRALGQIGDPGAVVSIERHAVRSLFSKPRTAIRIAAHRALAPMGTPQARRLLQQALGDKDPEVKAAVKQVLHMR